MFSRTDRVTFQVPNYNPGAGYYIGNQASFTNKIESALDSQKIQDGFGRGERFRGGLNTQSHAAGPNLGPGSYKILSEFEVNKAKLRPPPKRDDQPTFKVNAIPSIPSNNITAGYQEIGEGLLILMKGNKGAENDRVGPASYNPNFNFNRPKPKGFVIVQE